MIKINSNKGILYNRCYSIESHINKEKKYIRIISQDSLPLRYITYTNDNELKLALIAGVLDIYLMEDIIVDDNLVKIFLEETLLEPLTINEVNSNNWRKDVDIFYSSKTVKALVENGYKEGLTKEAYYFYENP